MGFWSGLLLGFAIGVVALRCTIWVYEQDKRGWSHNHYD